MFDGLCVTHVFLDEVQATVVGHEGSNLLSVLNQLNTSALSNSRVRLLGLNATATERHDKRGNGKCPFHGSSTISRKHML